ncbi:unnamed protein product [Schistosoma curassoni]|uniref:Reverse transcriptase domain-containing protein n=1 Tax=Schistosoma curassoni TaxID=6186 RepID=A0A183K0K7_9TREM|nr:unnamed protein product [Schistosoma curassoni]
MQWTALNQLEDLKFADGLALLLHTYEQMQMKKTSVVAAKGRSKILKHSTEKTSKITFDRETLEGVKPFTYLGSIIDEREGSGADVKTIIGKARAVFLQLKNV